MQALTNFFANLSVKDPALWLATAAGLFVILLFLFLGRRSARAKVEQGPENPYLEDPFADRAALEWMPASLRNDERRRSARRGGLPTPVFVADPKSGRRSMQAFVLDRSSGGIRIASQKSYATGTTLHVLPQNAPESVTWVAVLVRSCREVGDYYEVGCQFEQELPWNVLLLFG